MRAGNQILATLKVELLDVVQTTLPNFSTRTSSLPAPVLLLQSQLGYLQTRAQRYSTKYLKELLMSFSITIKKAIQSGDKRPPTRVDGFFMLAMPRVRPSLPV